MSKQLEESWRERREREWNARFWNGFWAGIAVAFLMITAVAILLV